MIEKNDALADEGDELFCSAFDKRRGNKLISNPDLYRNFSLLQTPTWCQLDLYLN